jgi:AmmeMemoRadiSam system protein B
VRIVPICVSQLPLDVLLRMGEGLAGAIRADGTRPLIISSSDMTHFEAGDVARRKDFLAIERALELDPAGLYATVRSNSISMCGVIPTVIMLQAALCLGAKDAELVAYSNSGDVTGDQSDVVGYAGIRVY